MPNPTVPPSDGELRRDAEAALAARAELGPAYDEHVAAGLADRVEELVAYRTAELNTRGAVSDREYAAEESMRRQRFVLGIISLGVGIPVTAISATTVEPGLLGMAVGWAGIVGVNVVQAWANRRR
jgi:hypothetical protein